MMGIFQLALIFLVGLVSASFSVLVGGGSLLTIPTLIFLGLPPYAAIATNRLGVLGVATSGWYEFHQKKLVDYRVGLVTGIPALFGAFIGANIVLSLGESLLRQIIAAVSIVVLIFIMVKPKIGIEKKKPKVKRQAFIAGGALSFFLGIYGGFYGAGLGVFFAYLFILLFGKTFLEVAGTRNIVAVLVSSIATVVFIVKGVVVYSAACALFTGNLLGSYLGAHYSTKIGNVWIKWMFFLVVVIMIVKLLL